jgi:hypothetical protein
LCDLAAAEKGLAKNVSKGFGGVGPFSQKGLTRRRQRPSYSSHLTNLHIFWSFYPLIGCVLLGAFLLLAGMCRPLREALEKKFFL